MTINIAVVTAEALVLGCDSIASTTEYMLDPFRYDFQPDESGIATIQFSLDDVVPQVTNAWGGVTKMFEISRSPAVAAVTAGLAKMNGHTIASLAGQFLRSRADRPASVSVRSVADDFLQFMRREYQQHYAESKLPDALKEGPLFLVGGYAADDHFPCLYRVLVQQGNLVESYVHGAAGVAWEGQSDSVERLLRGYDMQLRTSVDKAAEDSLLKVRESMARALARILQETLDRLGVQLPDDINTELPAAPGVELPWSRSRVTISYSNLPLQDAVDLAAFFVNLQSGKAKFAHGVATVGGRTHIGVVTRQHGFQMLDEPVLRHTSIGYLS